MQKQALKIIYGYNADYEALVENGTIETLEARRKNDILRFALNNCNSTRFGHWFPISPATRTARDTTRRIYTEKQCRTDRTRNNPIQVMIRMLNQHLQSTNI